MSPPLIQRIVEALRPVDQLLPVLLALALTSCIASGGTKARDYYDRPAGWGPIARLAMVSAASHR